MSRRVLPACVCALLLIVATSVTAAEIEFQPIISFNEQIFPSFVISTATMKSSPPEGEQDPEAPVVLGDHGGLLGVQFLSPSRSSAVTVTITCDEVMEPSTFTGKLTETDRLYAIYPRIRYRFSRLADVRQATPVSMTFKVKVGSHTTEQTATVMLRPINDCPLLVQEGEQLVDTSFTFAAYVNEQHPFLDKLLREALDIGIVDKFTGYQLGQDEVIRQVYSVWDALATRKVRYSSITATSVAAQAVASQHVRLLEESLNNSQANCVDGSVLFASALRKIGIEPFLVLKPGHCYVGFYVDAEKTSLLALETTLLGVEIGEDDDYNTLDLLEEAVSDEQRYPESWPHFASAIVAGSSDFEENREKFASPEEPEYQIIDIAGARSLGIVPIAFRGREKFVGNGLDDETMTEDESAEDAEAEDAEMEEESEDAGE